jgi:CheY-like chemotaxis protein
MNSVRILHIDDEPDIREVVQISLGLDPDFETRSCSSGQEALALVTQWLPDIILLDVMMPVLDGPATLALLRESVTTMGIPVIFMTARAQSREIEVFRSLGAAGVIQKPFDPMKLSASVRAHMQPGMTGQEAASWGTR